MRDVQPHLTLLGVSVWPTRANLQLRSSSVTARCGCAGWFGCGSLMLVLRHVLRVCSVWGDEALRNGGPECAPWVNLKLLAGWVIAAA